MDFEPVNSAQTETNTVLPIIQEEAVITKRVVETGKVTISKKISEHEEIVDVPLFQEKVDVERVPINQVVQERPAVRQDGETMIIPVVQEQVFYQKRLMLVEELHVRKQVVETHQPQKITLVKEEVEIKRSAENDNSVDKAY
ncbi:MAG: YsnF/AvaK domain-containing protein [Pyrinomonadaceae bacterium]